jgi:hypothetical protein
MGEHTAGDDQLLLGAGFDEAAVAALAAAGSEDAAGVDRLRIRPDDDPATVARHQAAGIDRCTLLEPDGLGIAHIGVEAEHVAADTH